MLGSRFTMHPTVPEAPAPTTPRHAARLLREATVVAELPRLALGLRRLWGRAPTPSLVVTIPGFKAPQATMAPLGAYLRLRGHRVVPWGLGTNQGDPEGDLERLQPRLEAWASGALPVAVVGWSLGGVIARELARNNPQLVHRVITYGTPAVGGPSYTLAAPFWGPQECARIAAIAAQLDATNPIQVPLTAIYSRNDQVVDWAASIDRRSSDVMHVEVGSSHVGLGLDPDVWKAVAWGVETPRGPSAR
ncbi:MAG: hypothetical protein KTR31_08910 [Myxococcales bacterium]|nr:hypothetical protein [Myxococcales bacterium]